MAALYTGLQPAQQDMKMEHFEGIFMPLEQEVAEVSDKVEGHSKKMGLSP